MSPQIVSIDGLPMPSLTLWQNLFRKDSQLVKCLEYCKHVYNLSYILILELMAGRDSRDNEKK